MPGTLYLVATPIGNLEDITLRALRVLKEVDLVAAEDTRHSRKLLNHFGIATSLTSYYAHNEREKGERLLAALWEGKSVALISDAGMPAISDPGYLLVRRCREEGIAVTAVPGPSALIAALTISGLPTERFAFEGFLPARGKGRRDLLRSLAGERRTLVFYEAPHRLVEALGDIASEMGEGREVAVARELTKVHEELFRGSAAEAAEYFGREKVRGEIVLLVAPAAEGAPAEAMTEVLRRRLAEGGMPMREIARQVARDFSLPGSDVYREALRLRQEMDEEGLSAGPGKTRTRRGTPPNR